MFQLSRLSYDCRWKGLRPNGNQPPMHKPALVAAVVTDNHGNVGRSLRGYVKARRDFGRSRSRFQRTRVSLNSKVAVKRPHISGSYSAAPDNGQGGCQSNVCTTQAVLLCHCQSYRLFNHTYSQNKPTTTTATINMVREVRFISARGWAEPLFAIAIQGNDLAVLSHFLSTSAPSCW
jgi:hypothetical protein